MNKPIVSTNVGDVQKYLSNDFCNDLTVEYDDSDLFAKKILYLYKNHSIRKQIGLANRSTCLNNFSLSKVSDLTSTIYSQLSSS